MPRNFPENVIGITEFNVILMEKEKKRVLADRHRKHIGTTIGTPREVAS